MTYLQIFQDKRELIEQYPNEDKGILLSALMAYAFDGTEPEFGASPARYVWPIFKAMVDASKAKCETNARNRTKSNERERTVTNPNESQRIATKANEPERIATDEHINQESRINNQESYITNNTNARANAVSYVSVNIPAMTEGNWEELKDFQSDLPDDLICRAVDSAAANGVLKWAYVSKILNKYLTTGIKTVEQAEAAESARQAKAEADGKRRSNIRPIKQVSEQQYSQRDYTDDGDQLPQWMIDELAKSVAQ